MLYDYTCRQGHTVELVRPLGTDHVSCPICGVIASRSHVHRFDVVGPTVDTRGMVRRFLDASNAREEMIQKAEAAGQRVERPNDWAAPKARAEAKMKRGELDYNPRTNGA